mmetsp:Transcript_31376/g.52696  ORF Transcript_31376/g.52696 Transcript_31376/m.52696 type:complete len:228 (+) Transcript_31376:297-980(+)
MNRRTTGCGVRCVGKVLNSTQSVVRCVNTARPASQRSQSSPRVGTPARSFGYIRSQHTGGLGRKNIHLPVLTCSLRNTRRNCSFTTLAFGASSLSVNTCVTKRMEDHIIDISETDCVIPLVVEVRSMLTSIAPGTKRAMLQVQQVAQRPRRKARLAPNISDSGRSLMPDPDPNLDPNLDPNPDSDPAQDPDPDPDPDPYPIETQNQTQTQTQTPGRLRPRPRCVVVL